MSWLFRLLMVLLGLSALAFAAWKMMPKSAHAQILSWAEMVFPQSAKPQSPNPKQESGKTNTDTQATQTSEQNPSPSDQAAQALQQWRLQPKVLLDPGHGGSDVGRYQGKEGRSEKDLVLDLSLRIARILREREIAVELTRTEDVYLNLNERVRITSLHPQSLFVSLHMNAHTSSEPHGVETFWYAYQAKDLPETEHRLVRARSRRLAQLVHRELMAQLPNARDRRAKSYSYQVVREPHIASILVESGFLSNPQEAKKLRDVHYREKIALGIANGIELAWKEGLALWPKRVRDE